MSPNHRPKGADERPRAEPARAGWLAVGHTGTQAGQPGQFGLLISPPGVTRSRRILFLTRFGSGTVTKYSFGVPCDGGTTAYLT
jgi:hypothetical protein